MTCQEGKGLNLRPCPPELRDALRALAQAEGKRLYEYLLGVLAQHVTRARPRTRPPAGDTSP
jgi:hypothetical protein